MPGNPADERRPGVLGMIGGGLVLLLAVVFIYQRAATSYFFNDDFQWLQSTRELELADLLRLDRYDHFYRPLIEIYFHIGQRLFGCNPLPFHVASITVHLLCTLVLFLFARALSSQAAFAALTAVFFSVQPGYVQAVVWVGAITDLLPALWYLLTLWMHLLFLQRRRAVFYVLALLAFACCLLTHESSATLLPMMLALEAMLVLQAGSPLTELLKPGRVVRYVPFGVLLSGYLVIAYVVNTRSYLVREGHYRFGWHAVPNMFRYIVALSVWKRALTSYVVIAAVMAALVARGDARLRFSVLWIFVTLAPASFFTWGIESRYLYLPAAGLAMVLADLMLALHAVVLRSFSRGVARTVTAILVAGLSVRFAVFAQKSAGEFPEHTRPYARLAAAVRQSNPSPAPGSIVVVSPVDAEGVPALYLEPAVQTAYCRGDITVVVR